MVKVLAACGAGIGSSLIIKRKIKKVFEELNVEVEIDHASLGTAKSDAAKYDIIFTLTALADNFEQVKDKTMLVGLVNIMDEQAIKNAVTTFLEKKSQ